MGESGRLGFLGQVGLLLWKHMLQRRRNLFCTLLEVITSITGAIVILSIRQTMEIKTVSSASIFSPTVVDSKIAGNLSFLDTYMLYAPNTTMVNALMKEVNLTLLQDGLKATTKGFSSEQEFLNFFHSDATSWNFPIAVIFNDVGTAVTWPTKVTYKIRPRIEARDKWYTDKAFPFAQKSLPREDEEQYYINRGFLYTQRVIDEALIRQWTPSANLSSFTWRINRIPYPPYMHDGMVEVVQLNLPLILMLSFLLSVIFVTKNIVSEKEQQLKESMKMMGLSSSAYWVSWFLQLFMFLAAASAITTMFLGSKLGNEAVLVHSDPSVIFVFLTVYSITIINFCLFVSTLFDKANSAAAFSGILYYALFFPYLLLRYEDMTLPEKLAACLLFNTAMSFGAKTIGLQEGTGNGIRWNTFSMPASLEDNFSLMHAMLMLILDSTIFFILAWYIDNVFPGTYGIAQPWYFPFKISYWCGNKQNFNLSESELSEQNDVSRNIFFEPDPMNLTPGIQMVRLKKVYGTTKVAVKGSTITMYEGQITVWLGQNGAGKSTSMSMLTGFTPPTSGTAFVNGYDICTDVNSIRGSLGVCPQHNILFDYLTVGEHLSFFAKLKRIKKSEIHTVVTNMATKVGLEKKQNILTRNLSGGQKRKLCVGIALIGGPKVIILDEPTSAMDPAARRHTWQLLQEHRAGRTILLSTHYMDEADALGDRIAIMVEGVIKCFGSSKFLKERFGTGYNLVLVKEQGCKVDDLTRNILALVKTARLKSEDGAELSYLLPENEVSQFPRLFSILEKNSKQLGISSFGVTSTTMEDAFLKISSKGSVESLDNPKVGPATRLPGVNSSVIRPVCMPPGRVRPVLKPSDLHTSVAKPVFKPPGLNTPSFWTVHRHPDFNTSTFQSNILAKHHSPVRKLAKPTIGRGRLIHVASSHINDQEPDLLRFNKDFVRLSSFRLSLSRFYAMLVKKVIHSFRNRLVSLLQLVLPVIFTITAITIDKTDKKDALDCPLTLDLSMFDGTISAYSTGLKPNFVSQALGSNYSSLFQRGNTIEYINRNDFTDINEFYLSQASQFGIYVYNKRVVIGADFDPTEGNATINATAWFSGQPYHSMPTALGYLMNAVARQATGDLERTITTINHPILKITSLAAIDSLTDALFLGFSIGLGMLFGMSVLTASFALFLIREQRSGAKHQQVVSGVGPFAFWSASFTWDLINFAIPCVVLIPVFVVFKIKAFNDNNLDSLLYLLMVFGIAVLPFTYILQFPFRNPATGFVVIIIVAITTGMLTMLAVYSMRIPSMEMADTADLFDLIFMILFPHYALGMGFTNFYVNHRSKITCSVLLPREEMCTHYVNVSHPCCPNSCQKTCIPFKQHYLDWTYPGSGRNVLCLFIQGAVYFSFLLMNEYQLPQKLIYYVKNTQYYTILGVVRNALFKLLQDRHSTTISPSRDQPSNEDSDVVKERERVLTNKTQGDVLVLKNLFKEYGTSMSVDHVCVGVPKQECFGLLGQNGAGKTTIFKMLTGDVMASAGDAVISGHSIKADMKQIQANLGYCPQHDPLLDEMTGRETLTMYARIRGVPPAHLKRVVNSLLSILNLEHHANKLISCYSGGQKRKLCTAIALVGDPAVILLDEPSAGLDPVARRQLWTVLSKIRASGKTLILTSHSMEECEALCTRIAIMVNGQLKCLGSPQHLKSKFGKGYSLTVKLATLTTGLIAHPKPLTDFIFKMFPGSKIFDDHQGYLHFQVPTTNLPLSHLFSVMEQARRKLRVEHYCVQQTTLEQLFLTVTRAQIPPLEVSYRPLKDKLCINFLCSDKF